MVVTSQLHCLFLKPSLDAILVMTPRPIQRGVITFLYAQSVTDALHKKR